MKKRQMKMVIAALFALAVLNPGLAYSRSSNDRTRSRSQILDVRCFERSKSSAGAGEGFFDSKRQEAADYELAALEQQRHLKEEQ